MPTSLDNNSAYLQGVEYVRISDSNAVIDNVVMMDNSSSPSNPPATKRRLYFLNGLLYHIGSDGVPTQAGASVSIIEIQVFS